MRVSQVLGQHGEDLAAAHLRDQGYAILERNWRSGEREVPGEIDIVAAKDGALVFCEVKTRRSAAYGSPAEAVTAVKAARLRRLAGLWLLEHPVRPAVIRIDVIAILVPRDGAAQLEHLRGVA